MIGALSARRVKELARAAGFDLARITSALPLTEEGDRYIGWVRAGRHGEMRWIDEQRARNSSRPTSVLTDAKSVVCLGLSYWAGHRPERPARHGEIARYAWGKDYHAAMGDRLQGLAMTLREDLGGEYRCFVDTGPVMDKALAARAGVGWYGKNSNVLTESLGSFVLLGEIVTSLELQPDAPLHGSCGSCKLCVIACPTGAIGPEYSVDSRKCISYLTIEHRGPIDRELRPLMGAWVFGCDICQDVCPPTMASHLDADGHRIWAAHVRSQLKGTESQGGTPLRPAPARIPGHPLFGDFIVPSIDLLSLLTLSHADYVEHFRGTAIRRAKVWMLRRNAAVALGNVGGRWAVPPLMESLRGDEDAIVRGHAAWALGRLRQRGICEDLDSSFQVALAGESDASVRGEIEYARAMVPRADEAVGAGHQPT